MADELEASQREAERIALNQFGFSHKIRKSALGRRLKSWYCVAIVFFVFTALAYYLHPLYFIPVAENLAKAFNAFGIHASDMSTNQFLILYYSSKVGLLIICLIPLLWTLKRITHMQALRSIHADKEALANTLEAILNSGLITEVHNIVCEAAVKEMFSSSFDLTANKHKGKLNPKDVRDMLNEMKEMVSAKISEE